MRLCIDCGRDISDRGNRSKRCYWCEKKHRNRKARKNIKKIYSDFYKNNSVDFAVQDAGIDSGLSSFSVAGEDNLI